LVEGLGESRRQFLKAVEEGRVAARGGELLEHEEVVRRIERLLESDVAPAGGRCGRQV
jgi:hypothetical protein